MLIKALVENTSVSKEFKCIHGLSLYVETKKHKLLFDLGPGKLFYENAVKMNINIEDIDTVVISHGHNDHGGALKTFLNKNKKAKIYVSESAFGSYYYSILGFKSYIGLDQTLKDSNRFVFIKDALVIDEELQIFSNITEHKSIPDAKNGLYQKVGKKYIADTFAHEQNLLICENGSYTLFAACAHNGIVNILEKANAITGDSICSSIGGFHLYHLPLKKEDTIKYLKELAKTLTTSNIKFYTCHCTGIDTYEFLNKIMGKQMNYISTGATLEL